MASFAAFHGERIAREAVVEKRAATVEGDVELGELVVPGGLALRTGAEKG